MYLSFVLEPFKPAIHFGRVGHRVGCPLPVVHLALTSVPARSEASVSIVQAVTVPTYSCTVQLGIQNEFPVLQ